ncbi:MAG TPA: metallophosphoesterase [Bryobacteraceae bacterium]
MPERFQPAGNPRIIQMVDALNSRSHLFPGLCALLLLGLSTAVAQTPWSFAVMSDPQFGMYAKNRNFAQEEANFEFVIANVHRLRPAFVVICGDLVNKTGDLKQIAEYKRILKQLDPGIKVYSVAGNHDVGNVPTAQSIAAFHKNIGPDYYSFTAKNILGIVLDSNLIRAPQADPKAAASQKQWLVRTLRNAKSDSGDLIVVFQHVPYFVKSADEPDNYFNIPKPARREYLNLLARGGVKYVFAGHTHHNAGGKDGPLNEIVTGAVGMPLGGSVSGFRMVAVQGTRLEAPWFCLGGVPNRFDLQNPFHTPCAQ